MKSFKNYRVGIDARMWNETGVGRYIRNILRELAELDGETEYVVFLISADYDSVSLPANFRKVCVDIRWHSLAEQIKLPLMFLKERLDLLWVPHFNAPLLYPKKFMVTIHDLTPLRVRTGKVSTLPPPIFLFKYFSAWLVFANAAIRSKDILTVSEYVKNDISKTFRVHQKKIRITYNAVSGDFFKRSNDDVDRVLSIYGISRPYLFYVGNAQPHKNLETLIVAFKNISEQNPKLQLVLAGKKTFFYKRIQQGLMKHPILNKIVFPGGIDDEDLPALYSGAAAFIYPSLYEGFGIQLLEAMACETPIVCSNVTSLPEIAGDAALYFNPLDVDEMVTQILIVLKNSNNERVACGILRAKEFSWKASAQKVYETIIHYGKNKKISDSF